MEEKHLNNIIDAKRLEVLDFLQYELPRLHKNLYYIISEAEYLSKLQSLRSTHKSVDNLVFNAEIARIVASVGDAHTSINIPVSCLCPVEFYWFSDGIYVINTSKEDEALMYMRLTHINGVDMKIVIEKMSAMISQENHSYLKSLLPKYLPTDALLIA